MKRLQLTILFMCILWSVLVAKDYPVKVLTFGNWADPTIVKYEDTYYMTSCRITPATDLWQWWVVGLKQDQIYGGHTNQFQKTLFSR